MSTPVPGVLSRRSHRRCARIRCAPPVARNATHSSHGAQEAHLHAEHDAPDHGHGRDQAVPGPADSLEGRQASRQEVDVSAPGQALPAPHRRGAERVVRGHGRRVHGEVRQRLRPLGCTVLQLAGPPSSSDAAASAAPSSGSARPPTHPPPTRSMTSTCRCSNAPVFSRMLL